MTLLSRLVTLPFRYFSRPDSVDALFPTLVAGCFGNDRNCAVAAEEISMRAVADYLRDQIALAAAEADGPNDGPDAARRGPPRPVALRGRLPEHLWERAADYFENLDNTATLD